MSKLWRWVLSPYYARMRKLDLAILWPELVKHAVDLDRAKAAFASHAFHDNAWLSLGWDTVYQLIDKLEAPK